MGSSKTELYKLVRLIRQKTNLNIIIYSGYNYIFLSSNRLCKKIIDLSDAIIAGQYDMTKRIQHSLYGSSNQEVILITSAFNSNDFKGPSIMEIIINQEHTCNNRISSNGGKNMDILKNLFHKEPNTVKSYNSDTNESYELKSNSSSYR